MNFLRKILLIAIISVFAGNAEVAQAAAQTIFNLPDNTPGLMKDKQIQKICGQDKECVHVIVPGTDAAIGYLNGYSYGYVEGFGTTREYVKARDEKAKQKDALNAAINCEENIYFPADGTQPTTEEAVKYSCANVNDDAITNWYMQMFGILGIGETASNIDIVKPKIAFINLSEEKSVDYILSGFYKEKLCRVIRPTSQWIDATQRADFVRDFKTIASSSVGRVLLYRILIEIRRYIPNIGARQEKKPSFYPVKDNIFSIRHRNLLRSLWVKWDNINGIYEDGNTLHYNNKLKISPTSISIFKENLYKISKSPSPSHVSLAHELIHWFHLLRCYRRFSNEKDKGYLVKLDGTALSKAETCPPILIGKYYYGNSKANWKILSLAWKSGTIISYEEMRTVLGLPSDCGSSFNYLEGDDLSENLYRICTGIPLRFGHTSDTYFVEAEIINKVVDTIYLNAKNYKIFPIKNCIFSSDSPLVIYNDIIKIGLLEEDGILEYLHGRQYCKDLLQKIESIKWSDQ